MGNEALLQLLQASAEEAQGGVSDATALHFDHEHDANWNRRRHFAAQKKAPADPRANTRPGAAWPLGPVTDSKSVEHDLTTYVQWVKEVERAYGPNKEAILQRLRRLYYSSYGGALGDKFDAVIDEQAGAEGVPLTSLSISFEALDGLYETGTVRTPSGDVVDVSHVLAVLDLKTAGLSAKAKVGEAALNVRWEGVLTWTGDLAWWFVQWVQKREELNDVRSSTPASEAGPADESGGLSASDLALLDELTRSKTGKDDLLGDLDGTIIAGASVRRSTVQSVKAAGRPITRSNVATELSLPVSALLKQYYGVGTRDANSITSQRRFPDFVRNATPPIPYITTSAGTVVLSPNAETAIYAAIRNTAGLFLQTLPRSTDSRDARSKYDLILREMARRFVRFLETGLAKGDAPWP